MSTLTKEKETDIDESIDDGETETVASTTDENLAEVANRMMSVIKRQYEACIQYKQPKLDKIMKAEELYFNIVTRTFQGRFNVPIPIVSGFVDTLLAKIDDEITINFDAEEESDKIRCKVCSGAWKYDSAPTRGMWAIKDILVKKLAIFSGRGIYCTFSASNPSYKNYFEGVDLFDFIFEPTGGWYLENHLYCGRENIFRTKFDLEAGDHYDQAQVAKLISATASDEYKKTNDLYQNRQKRHMNLGLDPETNNYTGVELFNMCEYNFYDTVTGKRYYIFFDTRAFQWIRIVPLEEITGAAEENEHPKYMFKSWATHTDYWNFLSKAPVDDVIPVAVAVKTVINFMMDEIQKGLWGMKFYDPEMVNDPSQLEWDRPDKLVQVQVPNGKRLADGVWQLPTGDKSTVTINFVQYMREFIGTESGVTDAAKGNNDDTKLLGVAQLNMGEVADRLGLTNKQYIQCYAELGDAYISGLKLCMPEKIMFRILGENGSESIEMTKDDVKFNVKPHIRITGGKTEARRNQAMQEAKSNSLATVAKLFPERINSKLAAEQFLLNGQWDRDEIVPLLDPDIDGDELESVKAAQAIRYIIEGETPKLYQGATTRFSQKIIDYALRKTEDQELRNKLAAFAIAHTPIIEANMARKQMLDQVGAVNHQEGQQPAPGAPQGQPAAQGAPKNSVTGADGEPVAVNPQ